MMCSSIYGESMMVMSVVHIE